MLNLNTNQIIAIAMTVLGVIAGSTAQLTDIFGASTAKYIITIAGFAQSIMSGIMVALTSQGAQVRNVAAMPGVQSIQVNPQANTVLAQIAVDATQSKVAPVPSASAAVQAIANSA